MKPRDPGETFDHLRLARETQTNERYRRRDPRRSYRPNDPRSFASQLGDNLSQAALKLDDDIGGFDDRYLLKIQIRSGERLPDLESIPGIKVVSHEERTILLAFATENGMSEFESRLTTLARDGTVTNERLLYALENFDRWTPEDRTGWALSEYGYPNARSFVLDVELWPQERVDHRDLMVQQFMQWLAEVNIEVLDSLVQTSLVMAKVRCTRHQAESLLLNHRDVRTVDLPPRLGVSVEMLHRDIGHFPPPEIPSDSAPTIAVLDSGLTPAHPLLWPAVGDVQGFTTQPGDVSDTVPDGHGTFVSALALYGDIETAINKGSFVPRLRLLSAKVFKDDGTDQNEFVESAIEKAVAYFKEEYGCRVFNLSYGDRNKVYQGGHLRGLAYTLDRLSREMDVLFVVSAGNRLLQSLPEDLSVAYPDYLFEQDNRLLDPGTALNVVTVGGLAKHDATHNTRRYSHTLEDLPVAKGNQPSPFTLCGPSVGDAIKPDVVEYAGNIATRGTQTVSRGLGVVSFNSGFTLGGLFLEDIGTSYAAPVVAHKAARLLAEWPDASSRLLRALLGAHARWPRSSENLLNPHSNADGRLKLLKAIGYGQVDDKSLFRSLHNSVTLIAEERIESDHNHYYEVPIPQEWWDGRRRDRLITVALAYTPAVRTTRLDYRASKINFSFVNAESLDEVTEAYKRDRYEGLPERDTNRWISKQARSRGTLQVSRWRFGGAVQRKRLFVVVTRSNASWWDGIDEVEPYALCVKLEDEERARGSLYNDIRAILQARAQIRIRV